MPGDSDVTELGIPASVLVWEAVEHEMSALGWTLLPPAQDHGVSLRSEEYFEFLDSVELMAGRGGRWRAAFHDGVKLGLEGSVLGMGAADRRRIAR